MMHSEHTQGLKKFTATTYSTTGWDTRFSFNSQTASLNLQERQLKPTRGATSTRRRQLCRKASVAPKVAELCKAE